MYYVPRSIESKISKSKINLFLLEISAKYRAYPEPQVSKSSTLLAKEFIKTALSYICESSFQSSYRYVAFRHDVCASSLQDERIDEIRRSKSKDPETCSPIILNLLQSKTPFLKHNFRVYVPRCTRRSVLPIKPKIHHSKPFVTTELPVTEWPSASPTSSGTSLILVGGPPVINVSLA